ncbi:Methyltransferase-like protein 17, mitochondrial [Lamellibrachia satsuma]|nr:Methyltransferase-like protein 17, mitochondrial [Lamellibrachia satsuma]
MQKRLPNFMPQTLFDFGSGVGSTLWAANSVWETTLQEHYCVDTSADMNTIARLLVQDGEEEKPMCFPNIYFRQYFPPSVQNKYDLVVSAFTLLELPGQAERLKAVLALWKKTDQFLVLAENGTYAGYQAVLEARDFLLQLGEEGFPGQGDESLRGHVFAPCPHDKPCPRYVRQDGTPCNFMVPYQPLKVKGSKQTDDVARFAFVVLRKGERPTEDVSWPRIVRPTSTPSRRVHCRTCAANGELQMSTITSSKHGRDLYWCGRASKWGDLLPTVPATADDTTEARDDSNTADTDATSDGNIGISGIASTDR